MSCHRKHKFHWGEGFHGEETHVTRLVVRPLHKQACNRQATDRRTRVTNLGYAASALRPGRQTNCLISLFCFDADIIMTPLRYSATTPAKRLAQHRRARRRRRFTQLLNSVACMHAERGYFEHTL